jgi:hypothetical protein
VSGQQVPEVPVSLACGGFRDEIRIFSLESVILTNRLLIPRDLKIFLVVMRISIDNNLASGILILVRNYASANAGAFCF